jgi:hypothetical protein
MILARDIGLGATGDSEGCCVHILVYIFTANWKLVALVAGVWLGALSVAGNIILFPKKQWRHPPILATEVSLARGT